MANGTILYPPIVDSSMPVFNKKNACTILYSLSKFNSDNDIKNIQISITYQKGGGNAVNKTNSNGRFRQSGIIIINQSPIPVIGKNNLYSININPEDIEGGWSDGDMYKVQIRFSSVQIAESAEEANWLQENEKNFSEWSTICIIKPINDIVIKIPVFDFNSLTSSSDINSTTELVVYSTTLDFHGTYFCKTENERLYSYQVILYDDNNNMLEDSGTLYTNEYIDSNQFKYLIRTELNSNEKYKVIFSYKTEHGYEEEFKPFSFLVSADVGGRIPFEIKTLDNINFINGHTHNSTNTNNQNFSIKEKDEEEEIINKHYLSLMSDEEEGRIGIKIIDPERREYNGNICIRRTDSKSNFTKWEDIKIINVVQSSVNILEPFYDYTIESGIWYKYALQEISINGIGEVVRGQMGYSTDAIIRNFNYSYLLGENGIQLKLKYNNEMSNFKINNSEGRMDTLGSVYPFITRNGNTHYKSFPVNGLITFNMDDMYTFASKKDIYNINTINIADIAKENIVNLYNDYNTDNAVPAQYDYIYERFFREKVLNFLHDGKPKLFKSSTEGNVIISLMDINTAPTQSLGRLTYSFSATGYEVAEPSLKNFNKYKFFDLGAAIEDFSVVELKLGQIIADFNFNENIFSKILEKYNSGDKNIAGYSYSIKTIKNLSIEINSQPFIIKNNSGELTIGNNIAYGDINSSNKQITIYGNNQKYSFDPLITFNKNSFISFLPFDESDVNNQATGVNATINFLFEYERKPYVAKRIKSQTVSNGIGQYYENTVSGTSIYKLIYYKYYKEWKTRFSKLSTLSSINIEANPGCIFRIKDVSDKNSKEDLHEINYTGVLNLSNVSNIQDIYFVGIRDFNTGEVISENINSDILIDYNYILTKGEYLNES